MGYPDRGWLDDGARQTVPHPAPPTHLYPTRVIRTPQGVPCQQVYSQDPVFLKEPEGLPRVPRPATLKGKKAEWPWWLGAPLRPQSTPNGGGSVTLAAELAVVGMGDSGRYGSDDYEEVWVPPTISYEREKISSKILRDLGSRDMIQGKTATSKDIRHVTYGSKGPDSLDTSNVDKQLVTAYVHDPQMHTVTRRASTPALEHTYQYPDRSLRLCPQPKAFWCPTGLYSSKIPQGRFEEEPRPAAKPRPASSPQMTSQKRIDSSRNKARASPASPAPASAPRGIASLGLASPQSSSANLTSAGPPPPSESGDSTSTTHFVASYSKGKGRPSRMSMFGSTGLPQGSLGLNVPETPPSSTSSSKVSSRASTAQPQARRPLGQPGALKGKAAPPAPSSGASKQKLTKAQRQRPSKVYSTNRLNEGGISIVL